MPELPEVEVVRAGLAPAVTGARIEAVEVYDERSLRRHDGPAEDFVERLVGRVFAEPQRRGKFMWLPLVPQRAEPVSPVVEPVSPVVEPVETALVTHLGMSGQVLLRPPGVEDRLTRIHLDVHHPTLGDRRLNFVDQRIFGSMAIDSLIPTPDGPDLVPTQVSHIARDPLDPLFDERAFLARLAKRNTGIKRALLDQGLVSGIGNIYADESLWFARIHGEHPTALLSRPRAKLLLVEVRAVLLRALAEGGTSFDEQYKNVNGNSGYFAHSLQAYGQQGKACPRCGTPIVREQFMNRGSHFCPRCQRLPRVSL